MNIIKEKFKNFKEDLHTIKELHDQGLLKKIKDKCVKFIDVDAMEHGLSYLRGHVTIIDDETGEVILDKDNLVVMRGRTFALEKMFAEANTLDAGYNITNLYSKKICLFTVGKGGCIEGQPFNVLPTIPSDCRELGEPVPFRLKFDGEIKPSGYYDERPLADDNSSTGYYAKTFDNIEWIRNLPDGIKTEDADEVCVKLTLKISEDDFKTVKQINEVTGMTEYVRSTFINELGLCIANPVQNEVTDRMDNIELATRLTFESEPYFSNTKSSTLYYYIYA